jgi:hypothetical protein
MERVIGGEPTTFSWEARRSTTELHPRTASLEARTNVSATRVGCKSDQPNSFELTSCRRVAHAAPASPVAASVMPATPDALEFTGDSVTDLVGRPRCRSRREAGLQVCESHDVPHVGCRQARCFVRIAFNQCHVDGWHRGGHGWVGELIRAASKGLGAFLASRQCARGPGAY